MANGVCINQIFMGDNKYHSGHKRKQYQDRGFIVHTFDRDYLRNTIQRTTKMAEAKLAAILLNLIGIPLCFIAFIQNLDNVKSAVLFMCALTFILIRIYFFVIWAKQKTRKNELENERSELENSKFRQDITK
jgi:hypothetical protein